ncbi:hypothetical protein [uncultured Gemmiger sp.]|uniref:hypothetical protein n=1 Tax=uncultured Gemmiger sp. TaxID=1623490 RepID=UPI0025EEC16D|nr:hypothetical protein [uncultured Gemmiger sp.]
MTKKKSALVLTLAMVFSLAPLSAYAETISTVSGAASCDVKATYTTDTSGGAGGTGGTVYSVDIDWGDMEFTYTAAAGRWDPATHTTTGADGGTWTVNNTDGNKITVTNHSNTAVTATINYTPASGYDSIIGSFDKTSLDLATAVGTEVSNAPSDSAALTLSGALDSATAAGTTIGTITVTLG